MRGRWEKAAVPVSPTLSRAAAACGDPAYPAFGVVDARKDPGRLRLQELSGRREGHLPRRSIEEGRVQFVLELADRVGQGRLRNEQLLGRPAKVAGVGHRGEVSQVTQLHVLSVRSWSCVMADTFDGKCQIHIEQGHVSALLMIVIDQSSARPGLGNCLV